MALALLAVLCLVGPWYALSQLEDSLAEFSEDPGYQALILYRDIALSAPPANINEALRPLRATTGTEGSSTFRLLALGESNRCWAMDMPTEKRPQPGVAAVPASVCAQAPAARDLLTAPGVN
jgi:hypothetical protein